MLRVCLQLGGHRCGGGWRNYYGGRGRDDEEGRGVGGDLVRVRVRVAVWGKG